MTPRRIARYLLNRTSGMMSFDTAVIIAKQLLAAQGMGAGGDIATSGEFGVLKLVAASEPLLFDVGGHVGTYTQEFLKVFPRGRSLIFEPSASHLVHLRQNLAANPAVTIYPVGLSDKAAELPLYKDKDISGLASLSQRRLDYMNIKLEVVETVTVRTLDSVVEETGTTAIDLLKMDVEGHELAVLKGGNKTFERGIVKLVQFEFGGCNLDTHTTLQDFYYFFKTYNFAIGLVQPSGRIQILEKYDEFYEQYRTANFVAAPRHVLAGH